MHDFLHAFTMPTYDESQGTQEKKVMIYALGTYMYTHISLSCKCTKNVLDNTFCSKRRNTKMYNHIHSQSLIKIVVNVAFAGCTLQRKVTSRPDKMEHLYTLLTVCNRNLHRYADRGCG